MYRSHTLLSLLFQYLPIPGPHAIQRIWELTTLKEYTDEVNQRKKEVRNIELEEIKCCGRLKQLTTIGLNDRLLTMFSTTNPAGRIWATCDSIAQSKAMMIEAYNLSVGVLPQERRIRARDTWATFAMYDWNTYDQFVRIFREKLKEYEEVDGPMSNNDRCHAFLNRLNSSFNHIK